MPLPVRSTQSGSALIVLILGLSVGMLLWFGASGINAALEAKKAYDDIHLLQMQQLKEALLSTALFVPEAYYSNSSGSILPPVQVRGIGYFPCPAEENGHWNGAPCGHPRRGYVSSTNRGDSKTGITSLGYLPLFVQNRSMYFPRLLKQTQIRYVVDERFVSTNGCYDLNGTGNWPYPVNGSLTLSDPPVPQSCGGGSALPVIGGQLPPPFLTVDGRTGYVALLLSPGPDQVFAADNTDGDDYFTRQNNDDLIVGIHFTEWSEKIAARWVNEKRYWSGFSQTEGWPWPFDQQKNPVGQSWENY